MRHRISDLINGGDWACAWMHHGGLAAVCFELATMLEPPLDKRALTIAERARVDMRRASREWAALADDLRSEHAAAHLRSDAYPPVEPARTII